MTDTGDSSALYGTVRAVENDKEHFFADEQALLVLLKRLSQTDSISFDNHNGSK
jgi:hypothetical protein